MNDPQMKPVVGWNTNEFSRHKNNLFVYLDITFLYFPYGKWPLHLMAEEVRDIIKNVRVRVKMKLACLSLSWLLVINF